jgi:hypothetical protein
MPNRPIPYEIVLELKYLKKKEAQKLPDAIQKAENQLDKYMNSARFNRPDVKGFYVVFLGGKHIIGANGDIIELNDEMHQNN